MSTTTVTNVDGVLEMSDKIVVPAPDEKKALLELLLRRNKESIELTVVQKSDGSHGIVELLPGKETILRNATGDPLIEIRHISDEFNVALSPDTKLKYQHTPVLTVVTNIDNGEYVGMQWEFFNDEFKAKACYDQHNVTKGHCATMRMFNERMDRQHMGAVHR